TGPDGPTHHGVFDISYMRLFPNMVVMAPGDERDVTPMLRWAVTHDAPTSIRYPKSSLESVDRPAAPIELGKAEVHDWGEDGCLIAFGSLFPACVAAAQRLQADGLHVGVVNARFCKPLDREVILKAVEQ